MLASEGNQREPMTETGQDESYSENYEQYGEEYGLQNPDMYTE